MIKFFESKNVDSRKKVTSFYTDIQVIDILHISPKEYFNLSELDKSALKYYLMVKSYHEEKQIQEIREKSESKNNLPKQAR